MIKIKNEELENIVKSMENKWKGEYIKLEQLAIDIQNEGAWTRYQVLKAIWDKFNLSQYSYMELLPQNEDN